MIRNFIAIIVVVFLSACRQPDSHSNHADALSLITRFCDAEFQGVMDVRPELAVYDRVAGKELNPIDQVVFWEGDPIMVASTFSVVSVTVQDTTGTALVEYQCVMRTKMSGVDNRVFDEKCDKRHSVTYTLVRKNNKWFVHNPPIPYISIESLIRYYSSEIKSMPKEVLLEEHTPRKLALERLKENLIFLEKLSQDSKRCL